MFLAEILKLLEKIRNEENSASIDEIISYLTMNEWSDSDLSSESESSEDNSESSEDNSESSEDNSEDSSDE